MIQWIRGGESAPIILPVLVGYHIADVGTFKLYTKLKLRAMYMYIEEL